MRKRKLSTCLTLPPASLTAWSPLWSQPWWYFLLTWSKPANKWPVPGSLCAPESDSVSNGSIEKREWGVSSAVRPSSWLWRRLRGHSSKCPTSISAMWWWPAATKTLISHSRKRCWPDLQQAYYQCSSTARLIWSRVSYKTRVDLRSQRFAYGGIHRKSLKVIPC